MILHGAEMSGFTWDVYIRNVYQQNAHKNFSFILNFAFGVEIF